MKVAAKMRERPCILLNQFCDCTLTLIKKKKVQGPVQIEVSSSYRISQTEVQGPHFFLFNIFWLCTCHWKAPPPHPGETWGIRQLNGKKEEKSPP